MNHLFTVAKYTFIDVYRSKVMMSIIFNGIGLLLFTYIASEFAYGAPQKVALDFGLGLTTISNIVMAIFIGATLLTKEIEQRTLYMILSRSISRPSFLLGKIAGLSSVLLINTLILNFISIGTYLFLGGKFQSLILWASFYSFLEAFLVLIFAVFFSLLTNTAMSVIYTIGIFIVGHSLSETSKIFFAKANPLFDFILKIASIIIPNFYKLNLKDFVLYQQSISLVYLQNTLTYFVLYTLFMFFLVSYIFKNKNLD